MKKQKLPKDPHSEAALKWCVKNWNRYDVECVPERDAPRIRLRSCGSTVAIIDLRDIIKKRQPLTGIKKQVAGIVRGKRKKKVRK